MTDSAAGALKVVIVAWGGVNERVLRDEAPKNMTMPYITFFELPATPSLEGDGAATAWVRGVQVSLWQPKKGEDRALVKSLIMALNGAHTGVPGVYGVHVADANRFPDPQAPVIQDALTVRVSHDGSLS